MIEFVGIGKNVLKGGREGLDSIVYCVVRVLRKKYLILFESIGKGCRGSDM